MLLIAGVLSGWTAGAAEFPGEASYAILRSDFGNARIRFEREKKGRVAFLGGSITEMTGWRDLTGEYLEQRFPGTDFEFINAGVSSTDSTLGAYRLRDDVFARGRVDLLFVEYAVNDQHNFRTDTERVRGMEGIIRQARRIQPDIDILVQYFVDPVKMELFNSGQPSPVIVQHETVCSRYGIPVNNLAREVTARINRGEFTWEQFGGLHPAPFGHRVYADSIARLFDAAWQGELPADAEIQEYQLPEKPLDPKNYERGRYISLEEAEIVDGWRIDPTWKANDRTGTRKQFVGIPMLEATEPEAELRLSFEGTAVGLLVVAGPDVGVLEYSIDGGPLRTLDQFTPWSAGLHIPWAYILDADLEAGAHELILRTSGGKHADSTGHAARIVQFLAN